MRAVALPVLADLGLRLEEKDVREDPVLEKRYVFEIPVLLLGETEVARHRVTAEELRGRLQELGLA
jgi:hypothetical protein